MNEAMNRFSYLENTVLRRVPGPHVPLQDEPQEVSDIHSGNNTKTVLVPQIQSMKDYILTHHKKLIFQTLNKAIAAKGALNYVDGKYIEPFAFDLGRGGGNYSFVLTREDLFEEYSSNPSFRKRMDSGHYVYADGHVCLNDEQYVVHTSQGLRLTFWANTHVD